MAQTRITADTGTTIKPGPMVTAPPERIVLDDDLAVMAADSGLNTAFLADVIASAAAHENMGINLFRALGAMTNNPMLQPTFAKFRGEAEMAVEAYEQLITRLGGRLGYISPAARMTEGLDTKMLESLQLAGSADPMTIELKGVELVLLSSTLCLTNVGLLRSAAEAASEGSDARQALEDAVAVLEPPAQRHLEWALETQQKLVSAQVGSKAVQTIGAVAEGVVAKVRDAVSRS